MPKKKIEKPQREMTKRQLSHWQRESRMQRITMIAGIIIIVAVLAIVGSGVYMSKYRPYQATVIKVENKQFNLDYYIDLLAYLGLVNGSPQLIQYMTDMALQTIPQDYLYIQEAAKIGVTVSDQEVDQELAKNKITKNQARVDITRAQLLQTKLKDYFDKNTVPASGDQRTVNAMFLESQAQAGDVQARIDKGEAFADIAAQLSLDSVSKTKRGDLGSVPRNVLPTLLESSDNTVLEKEVFDAGVADNTLVTVADPDRTKSLGYWLVMSTDAPFTPPEGTTPTPTPSSTATPAPQLHILAMLLGSKDQADQVTAALTKGGEGNDFATLAKANSQDANAATNGGDQGMLTQAQIKSKFGDEVTALFFPPDTSSQPLAVNKVSAPISETSDSTKGGVWLLKVGPVENKPIVDSDQNNARTILTNAALSDWQNKVWNDNKDKVVTTITDQQKSQAVTQAALRAK